METDTSGSANASHSSSQNNELQRSFDQLDARLARIEAALGGLQQATDATPQLVATVTDMADAWVAQAAEQGVDVDERVRRVSALAVRLSEPKVLDTVEMLIDRVEMIQAGVEAADQLPGLVAMVVDIFDAQVAQAAEQGLSIGEVSHRILGAVRRFAEFVQGDQFTTLVDSGVLDPHAIAIIGRAGRAMADVAERQPSRTGLFGMVRAASDSDIKRSLNFMVRFGKRFGQLLRTQIGSDQIDSGQE